MKNDITGRIFAGFLITILLGILALRIYQNMSERQAVVEENKCLAIPKDAFYTKLREKTLRNYRKKLATWNRPQRDQLMENARQAYTVNKAILEVGCEHE